MYIVLSVLLSKGFSVGKGRTVRGSPGHHCFSDGNITDYSKPNMSKFILQHHTNEDVILRRKDITPMKT